jgi:hypothetical protein
MMTRSTAKPKAKVASRASGTRTPMAKTSTIASGGAKIQ